LIRAGSETWSYALYEIMSNLHVENWIDRQIIDTVSHIDALSKGGVYSIGELVSSKSCVVLLVFWENPDKRKQD